MSRVKVVNGTEREMSLEEGTGGIFRSVKTLPRGEALFLKVDQNETYREYRCKIPQTSAAVTLTSDDCVDYEEVEIMYDDRRVDKLYTKATKRNLRINAAAANDQASGQSGKGSIQGLFYWLAYKLHIKKEPAPVNGGTPGNGGAPGHGGVGAP